MNVGCLSIYVGVLSFLSTVICSFQSIRFELLFIIPMHFNLFDATRSGITILISFSDCSLLVYTNKSDFCILTLYPTTLLKSFIIYSFLCVNSLGFSIYKIMSSANWDSFTSSFPSWMPFISFFLPNCPFWNLWYNVKRGGKSGQESF